MGHLRLWWTVGAIIIITAAAAATNDTRTTWIRWKNGDDDDDWSTYSMMNDFNTLPTRTNLTTTTIIREVTHVDERQLTFWLPSPSPFMMTINAATSPDCIANITNVTNGVILFVDGDSQIRTTSITTPVYITSQLTIINTTTTSFHVDRIPLKWTDLFPTDCLPASTQSGYIPPPLLHTDDMDAIGVTWSIVICTLLLSLRSNVQLKYPKRFGFLIALVLAIAIICANGLELFEFWMWTVGGLVVTWVGVLSTLLVRLSFPDHFDFMIPHAKRGFRLDLMLTYSLILNGSLLLCWLLSIKKTLM